MVLQLQRFSQNLNIRQKHTTHITSNNSADVKGCFRSTLVLISLLLCLRARVLERRDDFYVCCVWSTTDKRNLTVLQTYQRMKIVSRRRQMKERKQRIFYNRETVNRVKTKRKGRIPSKLHKLVYRRVCTRTHAHTILLLM